MQNKILIVGAGLAGSKTFYSINFYEKNHDVIGFIDDDKNKTGTTFCGLPVLGNRFDIPEIVKKHNISEIIISIPSAPPEEISKIIEICKAHPVNIKILPGTYDLNTGKIKASTIRDIELEDLLGRKPLSLYTDEIIKYLHNQVVLVTGAGGSVGTELCSHISDNSPAALIALGHGENSIYELEQKLKANYPNVNLISEIADIKDCSRIKRIFEKYKPGVVFHAAAHKHVPYMEKNPDEAIKNNILGTKVVCDAAGETDCEKFILISTDKAVKPTSIMGLTKRIAEIIILMMNDKYNTKFAAVRFGNILGSRGSVIPLFKKQIAGGGPVTITHPRMTRYFMTIKEAAQLVIQAGVMARGGEIFVLDMGDPICIKDLACTLIKLKGLEPEKDIKIKFTGIRPGEKISEILNSDDEKLFPTKHKKISAIVPSPVNCNKIEELFKELNDDKFPFENKDYKTLLKNIVD